MNGFVSSEERLRIDELRAGRYAGRTREGYDGAWRTFCRWLEARGVPTEMPVSPELVALFAVEYSDGYALASVENFLKGIAYMHRGGGYPSPTNDAIVKDVLTGLRRIKNVGQKQAVPLYAVDIEKIIRTACNPRPSSHIMESEHGFEKRYVAKRRGRMEIAIVMTMRDGLLRVSEARELLWKDVTWSDDGSGTVYIRHAKGDQKGEGAVQWLSHARCVRSRLSGRRMPRRRTASSARNIERQYTVESAGQLLPRGSATATPVTRQGSG